MNKIRSTNLLRHSSTPTSEKVENTKVYDYASKAESLKRNAGFSFKGWGGAAQVNFGLKEKYKASSDTVSYVNSRLLIKDFMGWTSLFPPMNLDALLMLEQQGPEKFA